jgi:hypothetical protein
MWQRVVLTSTHKPYSNSNPDTHSSYALVAATEMRLVMLRRLCDRAPPYLQCPSRSQRFYLFGPLKKHLSCKRFATDADVKQAVTSLLRALDTDIFHVCVNKSWWHGGRKASMSLRRLRARSGVYHLLHMLHAYMKVSIKFSVSDYIPGVLITP